MPGSTAGASGTLSYRELAAIVENAAAMIQRVDTDLRITYVNAAIERMFGVSRESQLGRRPSELGLPEAHWRAWESAVTEVLRTGTEVIQEFSVPVDDGVRYFRSRHAPELDEDARVRGVITATVETTDQQWATETLRVLGEISVAMTEAPDARGALTVALRRTLEVTGWPVGVLWLPDPSTGQVVCDLALHDGSDPMRAFEDACRLRGIVPGTGFLGTLALARGAHWEPDLTTIRDSRRIAAAVASGLHGALVVPVIADGEAVAVMEFFVRTVRPRDRRLVDAVTVGARQLGVIVRRKQAEDALHWQQGILRAVTAASPQGLLVIDPESTRILLVNERFIEIWGLETHADDMRAGRLRGMDVSRLVAPQLRDPEAFLRSFVPLRDVGARVVVDDELALRDGRVLRRFSAQIRDESDRCLGRMYLLEDITERTRLDRQLRQSQKMEAIGRLAGGIAHDFNNLLTVIRSYSDFLLEDMSEADARREDVGEIRTAADRAAALTKQLLGFSRAKPAAVTTLDLNATVSGLEKMLARLIGDHVTVTMRLAPSLPPIRCDVGGLEQTIVNLVVNARDALPSGGTISLATSLVRLDEPRRATIGELSIGEYVALSVSDDGHGMDDATRVRVFEPFFTTKEVGQGTGLGLATVYGSLQQCGGDIEVVSAPGSGTTFTLYFPALATAEGAGDTEGARSEGLHGSERILVVDDEPSVRRLAARLLASRGYRTVEAGSPEEALRFVDGNGGAFDLLLTDIVMPGMSGRELAVRLRERQPSLHVMYMSGFTADAFARPMEPEEVFVGKPFTPEQLLRSVREALARKRRSSA
jgi:PAS domain S-box-containing protein